MIIQNYLHIPFNSQRCVLTSRLRTTRYRQKVLQFVVVVAFILAETLRNLVACWRSCYAICSAAYVPVTQLILYLLAVLTLIHACALPCCRRWFLTLHCMNSRRSALRHSGSIFAKVYIKLIAHIILFNDSLKQYIAFYIEILVFLKVINVIYIVNIK